VEFTPGRDIVLPEREALGAHSRVIPPVGAVDGKPAEVDWQFSFQDVRDQANKVFGRVEAIRRRWR